MTSTLPLEALNERALLHHFGELVRQANEANATVLRYIDAIDRRQLWAKLGHPSMFDFLVTASSQQQLLAKVWPAPPRRSRLQSRVASDMIRGRITVSSAPRVRGLRGRGGCAGASAGAARARGLRGCGGAVVRVLRRCECGGCAFGGKFRRFRETGAAAVRPPSKPSLPQRTGGSWIPPGSQLAHE